MGKRKGRSQQINAECKSRVEQLTNDINAAIEGTLNLKNLKELLIKLQKPIEFSDAAAVTIEDCHPSGGRYKRALPKGYLENIKKVKKAITKAENIEQAAQRIHSDKREIVETFNHSPKKGIKRIKDICEEFGASFEKELAKFFHSEKLNLDLEGVGDYLSQPEAEQKTVLNAFTGQINLAGQDFIKGLRIFLKTFKLPGEAQKIDRLIESYSYAYCRQNSVSFIANSDAAYILAFQMIMVNTDLHNPQIAPEDKMSLPALKRNLRGLNNGANFDEAFLEDMYNEIKENPLELNFVKINPGYEFSYTNSQDELLDKLDSFLETPDEIHIDEIIPGLPAGIKATVDSTRSWWFGFLTGYEGTITLADESTLNPLVKIHIFTPNILSKWIYGEHSKIVIEPIFYEKDTALKSIDVSAQVAASFNLPVSIKATYDYLKTDLQRAYIKHKTRQVAQNGHSLFAEAERQQFTQDPEHQITPNI